MRWLIRLARPIDRGIQRLAIVPPSTAIVWMRSWSIDASPPERSSALAAADLIALEISPAALLGHQIEQADRLLDLPAADEVGHDPHLAGRHRDAANECACLHDYFFRSPLWPWNVRVSENSPSL